jgi:hypothetical protein
MVHVNRIISGPTSEATTEHEQSHELVMKQMTEQFIYR